MEQCHVYQLDQCDNCVVGKGLTVYPSLKIIAPSACARGKVIGLSICRFWPQSGW